MNKKILVTGSEGFIGSHTVDTLEDYGYDVREFDIARDPEEDASHWDSLHKLFEENDFYHVVHLAAEADVWTEDYTDIYRNNVQAVFNVAKLCRDNDVSLTFTTSIAEDNPTNAYAGSKLVGSRILKDMSDLSDDFDYSILTLPNVVGEGHDKGQVYHMISQAINDGEIEVWGNGEIKRSYVDVKNVAEAIQTQIEGDKFGGCTLATADFTNEEVAKIIQQRLSEEHNMDVETSKIEKEPPSPKHLTADEYIIGHDVKKVISRQVDWMVE